MGLGEKPCRLPSPCEAAYLFLVGQRQETSAGDQRACSVFAGSQVWTMKAHFLRAIIRTNPKEKSSPQLSGWGGGKLTDGQALS